MGYRFSIGPDEYLCPGVGDYTTTECCEAKGRGAGCSELKTCPVYLAQRKIELLTRRE